LDWSRRYTCIDLTEELPFDNPIGAAFVVHCPKWWERNDPERAEAAAVVVAGLTQNRPHRAWKRSTISSNSILMLRHWNPMHQPNSVAVATAVERKEVQHPRHGVYWFVVLSLIECWAQHHFDYSLLPKGQISLTWASAAARAVGGHDNRLNQGFQP